MYGGEKFPTETEEVGGFCSEKSTSFRTGPTRP